MAESMAQLKSDSVLNKSIFEPQQLTSEEEVDADADGFYSAVHSSPDVAHFATKSKTAPSIVVDAPSQL